MSIQMRPEILVEPMAKLLKEIIELDSYRTEYSCSSTACEHSKINIDNVTSTRYLDRFRRVVALSNDVQDLLGNLKQLLRVLAVSEIFEVLPSTGQLLGRLCGIPQLIKDNNIYQFLMECILSFYRGRTPDTPLEAKAKSWAIGQLRNTVNVSTCGKDGAAVCLMGANPCQLYQQHVLKVVEDTAKCLRSRTTHCVIGCGLDSISLSPTPGLDVGSADAFQHLLGDPQMAVLTEAMFEQIAVQPDTEEATSRLQHLTEYQRNARNGKVPALTYKLQSLLWLSYLPCLEEAVLWMMRSEVLQRDGQSLYTGRRLQSGHLPKACADHSSIYLAVCRMFEEFLLQTDGDWRLVQFIGVFHNTVRQARIRGQIQGPPLCCLYSSQHQQLVTLLQVSPTDMTSAGIFTHLELITRCVDAVSTSQTMEQCCELWKVLIQFPDWYKACLSRCLSAEKHQLDGCVGLMLWYYSPLTAKKTPDVKASLVQTVSMLQALMGKTHLKPQDVEYAVSANNSSASNDVTSPLIGQILMIFLFLSKSGLSVGQFILNTDGSRWPFNHRPHETFVQAHSRTENVSGSPASIVRVALVIGNGWRSLLCRVTRRMIAEHFQFSTTVTHLRIRKSYMTTRTQASQIEDPHTQLQLLLETVDILGGMGSLHQLLSAEKRRELHDLVMSVKQRDSGQNTTPSTKLSQEGDPPGQKLLQRNISSLDDHVTDLLHMCMS